MNRKEKIGRERVNEHRKREGKQKIRHSQKQWERRNEDRVVVGRRE